MTIFTIPELEALIKEKRELIAKAKSRIEREYLEELAKSYEKALGELKWKQHA